MKFFLVGWMVLTSLALWSENKWQGNNGNFSADISVQADEIHVPTPIILKVVLRYPHGFLPDFAVMKTHLFYFFNPLLPSYHLVKEEINPSKFLQKELKEQIVIYTLEPLVPGKISLSLLNIPFLPEKEGVNSVELFTGILSVNITLTPLPQTNPSSLGLAAPLLPLIPGIPMTLSLSNREKWINNEAVLAEEQARNEKIIAQRSFPWILIAIIIGSSLIYLGWKKLEVYQQLKTQIKTVQDPQKKALDALANIQHSVKSGQEKEGYMELSETVRSFIEEAFKINILDKTTEEFIRLNAQQTAINPEIKEQIAQLLKQADLVKFSSYSPTKAEYNEALRTAKSIILQFSEQNFKESAIR